MAEDWSRWDDGEPIELYCDDDRHGRGKVAEVAVLLVMPPRPGQWQVNLTPYAKTSRLRRRTGYSNPHKAITVENHYEIPCPLCPRSPQLNGRTLEAVADAIAQTGERRVSLNFLQRCADTLRVTDGIQ